MNYIDLIICLPIAWGAFRGFKKGFVVEIGSLIALIAGIFGAIEFSSFAGGYLSENLNWSPRAIEISAFALTFLMIVIAINLIARLIQRFLKAIALSTLNRVAGLVFGMLKYIIILSGLLYLISMADSKYPFMDPTDKEGSLLYSPLSELVPALYPSIESEF